jgi:hypothetical protein
MLLSINSMKLRGRDLRKAFVLDAGLLASGNFTIPEQSLMHVKRAGANRMEDTHLRYYLNGLSEIPVVGLLSGVRERILQAIILCPAAHASYQVFSLKM